MLAVARGARSDNSRQAALRRVSQIAGNGGIAVGVIAPAAAIAGLAPVSILDRLGLRRAGVATAVGGIGATVAAQLAMGDSWRGLVDPEERTVLVTTGPFRRRP